MFYSLSASLCDIMTEVGALNPSAWVDRVKVLNTNILITLSSKIQKGSQNIHPCSLVHFAVNHSLQIKLHSTNCY